MAPKAYKVITTNPFGVSEDEHGDLQMLRVFPLTYSYDGCGEGEIK